MFCRRVLTSSVGTNVNKNLNMNLNKGDGNGCNNKEVCSNRKEGRRRCTEEGREEGYAGRQEDRQGHGEASGQEDGCQEDRRQKGSCQEDRRQKSSCQGCCQTRCQGREAGSQETRSQEVVYWYQNCPRCVG